MSRTFRKGNRIDKFKKEVRDGSPKRYSHSCENNGSCSYCQSNRNHKNKKRIDKSNYQEDFED